MFNKFIFRYKLYIILGIIAASVFIISMGIGRLYITPDRICKSIYYMVSGNGSQIDPTIYTVVFNVRLPRLLGNMFVGAALAVCGAVYQGVFRNPLVSPDILGVSSGAAAFASFAILLGLNDFFVQALAFTGGLFAVSLAGGLARIFGSGSALTLILAGIIVSGFMSSLLSFARYVADPNTSLPLIVFWLMGSMAKIGYREISIIAPLITVNIIFLFLMGYRINILSSGDSVAGGLGMDVKNTRRLCIISATLLTATSVSVCGNIGWFGLVIPHLARIFSGSDNSVLIISSAFCGAIAMIFLDTLARAATGGEIPMGVLTGLVIAPVFCIILVKTKLKVR